MNQIQIDQAGQKWPVFFCSILNIPDYMLDNQVAIWSNTPVERNNNNQPKEKNMTTTDPKVGDKIQIKGRQYTIDHIISYFPKYPNAGKDMIRRGWMPLGFGIIGKRGAEKFAYLAQPEKRFEGQDDFSIVC